MIFQILAVFSLLCFYAIYFAKMLSQRSRGIKTNQMGKRAGKNKSQLRIEVVMSFSTVLIVIVQLASIAFDFSFPRLHDSARFTGFCLAMIGNALFLIAVLTMRDSWRAGIPAVDKTEFVERGIYRYSRNPAFFAFDLTYVGILLMFFNFVLLAFTLFVIIMLHLQILQEEKYLAKTFGDQYAAYKHKVFRYLGRRNKA